MKSWNDDDVKIPGCKKEFDKINDIKKYNDSCAGEKLDINTLMEALNLREELEGERNISSIAILPDVLNFMDMLYVNMGKELNMGKYVAFDKCRKDKVAIRYG